jgi:hypothetical protein
MVDLVAVLVIAAQSDLVIHHQHRRHKEVMVEAATLPISTAVAVAAVLRQSVAMAQVTQMTAVWLVAEMAELAQQTLIQDHR